MRHLALLLALFALAPQALSANILPPNGDHRAGVYVPGLPQRAEELGAKMQQALAADPAWLQSYIEEKQPQPGEMLPYHEKLGVTREEYAFLVQSFDKMSLNKVGEVTVQVRRANGKVVISIRGSELPVDTFEFSPDGTTMTCAVGRTNKNSRIDQTDARSPTGKWQGTQWEVQRGDVSPDGEGDLINLKFAVGVDSAQRHLIYVRLVGQELGRPFDIGNVIRWPD